MDKFRQAKWSEPLIFEKGSKGRKACSLPALDSKPTLLLDAHKSVPEFLKRRTPPELPELSEGEVIRHFFRLSQMNFGVDFGFYPLGSCTMKYNPKINEAIVASDKVRWVHPYQPEDTMQGTLEIMYKLASWIAEITGTTKVSLQPAAGAHGELVGALIIRAYHQRNGELDLRNEIIIPDSAHGTNPASASIAGFKRRIIPTSKNGCINVEALKEIASSRTAGIMLTNPNTLGIFEENILEIETIVHEAGGLLYYDGANLNALFGKTRPGDMGFDIVQLNLHKTFSTPHGGGGPGAGPLGVKEHLEEFLPIPIVEFDGKKFFLNYDIHNTVGKVRSFYGNFDVLLRAYAYILTMGANGLEKAAEIAVLNANYLESKLKGVRGFDIQYGRDKPKKHEFVLSCSRLKSETGITAKHVAKRLLDYGVHAPTIYFPSIVKEALMIEPTETESIEELDMFIEILTRISKEAYSTPNVLLEAPHNTSINLVNEVKASHPQTRCFSWRMYQRQL